jgi:hypothetical protein
MSRDLRQDEIAHISTLITQKAHRMLTTRKILRNMPCGRKNLSLAHNQGAKWTMRLHRGIYLLV